jgi:hypothetical protein
MRFEFAPVMRANARQSKTIRTLRQENDRLRHELAVQERRASRWRRTALELAPKVGPRAMDVCLMQAQSDELADLPEVGY